MTRRFLITHTPAYIIAAAACGLTAALALPLRRTLDPANIIMLFLLVVFLVALRLGRGPAVMAAIFSVVLFDFVFVPPHLAFIPTDAQYVVTLSVMLAVALVTAQLTAGSREQTLLAQSRERQTERLYQLARDLAGAQSHWTVQGALDAYFRDSGLRAILHCLVEHSTGAGSGSPAMEDLVRRAVDSGETVAGQGVTIAPLKTPTATWGVLVITGTDEREADPPKGRERFDVAASLAAIAVERLHSVEAAEEARLHAASDKLRASLLSALSHDLRTPLTALVGMADSLALGKADAPEEAAGLIRDQARHMERLISNLLEMARLQAGRVVLRKEWQLLDDVIAAALRHLRLSQNAHPVRVRLAPDLPLVHFDGVLMERVVWNLLENAVKYSPPDAPVEITAAVEGDLACLAVRDRGPGFPPDRLDAVFDLFVRGATESALPGVGLGLAICRAIVEAHGGTIRAENAAEGGACVRVWLPLGTPPPFVDEEADEARP